MLPRRRLRSLAYVLAALVTHLAPRAANATPPDVVIYAADVPSSGVHGTWTKANDASAADGIVLSTADDGVSQLDAPLASPSDYFEATFTPVTNTSYKLWLRLRATGNSKWNDSVWVQFSESGDGANTLVYSIGSASGLLINLATDSTATSLNGWGWQNTAYWLSQTTTFAFATAGQHTLRVQVREDGVQVDQEPRPEDRESQIAPSPAEKPRSSPRSTPA